MLTLNCFSYSSMKFLGEKMNQKTIFIILFSIIIFAFGCSEEGGGGSSDGPDPSDDNPQEVANPPKSISLENPKALFIDKMGNLTAEPSIVSSNSEGNNVAYSESTDPNRKVLKQISQDNQISEVIFQDSSGDQVELSVTDLIKINNDYIIVEFVFNEEIKKALIDISDPSSDCVLYDVTDFSADYFQVRDNYLFALSNNTIQRLDLNTLTVQAMNNPDFDPLESGKNWNGYEDLLIGNGLNIIACRQNPSGCINYIFYNDFSPPRQAFQTIVATGGGGSAGLVYGEDGFIYQIQRIYSGCAYGGCDPEDLGTYIRRLEITPSGLDVTADQAGDYVDLGSYAAGYRRIKNSYALDDRNRYILFNGGFFTMDSSADGSIILNWTDLTLTDLPDGSTTNVPLVSKDYVYWRNGDSILRQQLTADSTQELIVTDSNMISFEVVGTVVIFSRYNTAVEIATYQVIPGNLPELLYSSDMEVQKIVELEL